MDFTSVLTDVLFMQFETKNAVWIGGPAHLLEPGDRDLAWAERSIRYNPALKWIVGKYVEADRANSNMQYWSLENLRIGQPTIANSPLNMLHQPRRIVGHFTDSEMLFPEQADDGQTPFVEALAAFYRYYAPEELAIIERAHADGQLYFSMECASRSVTCSMCSNEYAYRGPSDPSYCGHINSRESSRQFNDPTFLGGALIVPPVKPGWKNASVKDISDLMRDLMEQNALECEMAYEGIKTDLPDQDPKVWEALMAEVVGRAEEARDFNAAQRKAAAKTGAAMPDGSFPIKNAGDLKNAIRLADHAKNPMAAKAHIRMRAAALGLSKQIPADW